MHTQGPNQNTAGKLARDLKVLQQRATQLDKQTSGLIWQSGRSLPGLSGSVRETDAVAHTAGDLSTQVLPAYIELAQATPSLRTSNGDIDVAALTKNAGPVSAATARLGQLTTRLLAVHSGGIRPLDDGRVRLLTAMSELKGYGTAATTALRVGGPLLGADGPRTTLVILESPAESRAGGGLVGGYVLLRANHGHISMVGSGTNHDLANTQAPVISLGAQYDALYTVYGGRDTWIQSNLSPDFAKTGELWRALFRAQYGITPDTEIGITPALLDDLLAVTGPVTLPGGERIEAGQADRYLQIGLYAQFPTAADEAKRNAYQLSFLKSTVSAMLANRSDPSTFLRKLGPSVDAGALRLHVTDRADQARIAATPLGGALPATPGPYFGVFANITDATKLGAYLVESVTYSRSTAVNGKQAARVEIALVNQAPTTGLPTYVATRLLPPGAQDSAPGSFQFLLNIYLATDARNPTVMLDGKIIKPLSVTMEENHLLVILFPPPLAPGGGHETVTVTATEPASDAPPAFMSQPSLIPIRYEIAPTGSSN